MATRKKTTKELSSYDKSEEYDIDVKDVDEGYDETYPEDKPGKKSRSVYRQGGKYRATKVKPG